ncbi:MAG: FtsH protease activity modulator HflK [Chromatiales bacterium]|nr:FtsH protease activity modulator HflK [Chromatiales bacterium]
MGWNESGNGKNPWERGNRNEGPPDLDKIVREWQQKLGALLRGGGGSGGREGSEMPMPGAPLVFGVLGILVLLWLASGLYRVDDAQRGVVLRFGEFQTTANPGLRWHIPWPIEQVNLVNVNQISTFSQQTRMLTADENIVEVDLVVQFRREDPVKFLFNVRDPDGTVNDASESAIREIVGRNRLDFIITEGRTEIADSTREVIQQTLDEYGTGIRVVAVNLQDANFPPQVQSAVEDAIKAREDRERLALEAQTYANDRIPRARGEAARRREDAEAYRARVIADAEGQASRFEQVLVEYQLAPQVTRERLYIEAIEDVLSASTKVLMDVEGGNNLLYLPLDKLMEQRGSRTAGSSLMLPLPQDAAAQGSVTARDREDRRLRSGR